MSVEPNRNGGKSRKALPPGGSTVLRPLMVPATLPVPGPLALPPALPVPGPLSVPPGLPVPTIGVVRDAEPKKRGPRTAVKKLAPPRLVRSALVATPVKPPKPPAAPKAPKPPKAPAPPKAPKPPQSVKAKRRGGAGCLPLLLVAVVPVLLIAATGQDEDGVNATPSSAQSQTPSSVSSSATPADSAVGMPIPGGNAPVRPVRIVLAATARGLPLAEQRELARWVERTQHPDTRVRILRSGRITAPLTAGGLLERSRPTKAASLGRRWLRRGARERINGGLIRLNRPIGVPLVGARLRTAAIEVSGEREVRRAIAAKIAREIMVSSRQRMTGTSNP